MDSVRKAMSRIFEKCEVCIDGCVISKELLIRTFSDFISSTAEEKQHNIGFVLHTGSICFDATLLAYAAVSNILYNETNAADFVRSLRTDDVVLRYYKNGKNERKIFRGIVPSPYDAKIECVLLQNDKGGREYLPEPSWNKIGPYYGESKSMDGRGLRKENKNRSEFFRSVLEMQDIPRSIDTSTVIVMPRDKANHLIGSLSFRFKNTEVKFTDLVPISYFTESDREYQYGTNPAKIEPVLKITGKISVARKLLLRRGGNNHIGLIVLGEDSYRRGESELPELLNRKSVQYVYLCMHIDSEISVNLIENYADARLFACTKDFLLSNSLPPAEDNPYTRQMDQQIEAITEKEVTANIIPGFMNWNDYKNFKKKLYAIRSSEYDSDDKDSFIMQSYSLMNLFMTAVFSIGFLEDLIDTGVIGNVEKPELRLQNLKQIADRFPSFLRESSATVINALKDAYLKLYDGTPKETAFLETVKNSRGNKTAVIVPKAYYEVVIDAFMKKHGANLQTKISAMTVNRFDNSKLYDAIIAVGDISGKRFDAFRCRSSREINILLYDCEQYRYKKQVRDAKAAEQLMNRRSAVPIDVEYIEEPIGIDESELQEVSLIDNNISDYVNTAPLKAVRSPYGGSEGTTMAQIAATAIFDTDEFAFFSKNYKAYVLDEATDSVNEVPASELSEGDVIVFTRSNSKTRDIVEELLDDMIKNGLVSQEVYNRSREWKTTLVNYMERTGSSAKQIANQMIANGVGVQEVTIRSWLDEESHTVRPKKLDSIRQIALISENDELFVNAESCYEAGGQIYQIRRQILNAVGQAILGEITGKHGSSDSITEAVADKIQDAAVTLRIESITFSDDEVPVNMVNRPLMID